MPNKLEGGLPGQPQEAAKCTGDALQARNQELESLTENIPGGVHSCCNDSYFSLISMSQSFFTMLGYTRQEIATQFHNQFIWMIHPEDRDFVLQTTQSQLKNSSSVELEYRVIRKDGTSLWILDRGKLAVEPDGRETFYCMLIDITTRKEIEEELRLSLERHQVIMDQATDVIFEWDIPTDTLLFSSNFEKKFGYRAISKQISQRLPYSTNIHSDDMAAFVKIMQDIAAGVPYSETEFRIRDAFGDYLWCRIRATAQFDRNSKPLKAIGVILDIDEEKKREQKLLDQAQKDALTGLLNKDTLRYQINESLALWSQNTVHALMIIDLDHFKHINDTFGHLCGDAVLSDTAGRLKKIFRSADLIGRIGGDEFLVFLPNIKTKAAAEAKARQILITLSQPALWESTEVSLSCSIGIAMSLSNQFSYLELYRAADYALYQVKNNGRGSYAFYLSDDVTAGAIQDISHTAVNKTIDTEIDNLDQTLARYTFSMLYEATDLPTAINQILEIVGRAYDIHRIYIFEHSQEGMSYQNTFEWFNDRVRPTLQKHKALIETEDLNDYFSNFDSKGLFLCCDPLMLSSNLQDVLDIHNVTFMLQSAIRDGDSFIGFVGFNEYDKEQHWSKEQIRSLHLIANVISSFLLQHRLKERLAEGSEHPRQEIK